MKHGLIELYELIGGVLGDPSGFPLRAVMTGIAFEESHGDPLAFVLHDGRDRSPSTGLYMVHQPAWPEIYAATEAVRTEADGPSSDEWKIQEMTRLAEPILADALKAAVAAGHTLNSRGFSTTVLDTALFVDAAWQTGSPHLSAWARSTKTGDPREIVNPSRTVSIEAALRDLAHGELGVVPGVGVALSILGGLAAGALVLSMID